MKSWAKYIVIASLLLALPSSAFAAVAFLNSSTAQFVAATSVNDTTNMSVTASGSNRVAFACLVYYGDSAATISSVTFGGQAMTSTGAAASDVGHSILTQAFRLINPPTGTQTLAVSTTGSVSGIYYNIVAFTGVDQTTPIRPATYLSESDSDITVTSNTSDLSWACESSDGSGATANTQTEDSNNEAGSHSMHSSHATAAASSVNHKWTTGSPSAIVGLSVQTVQSSVTPPPAKVTFMAPIIINGPTIFN